MQDFRMSLINGSGSKKDLREFRIFFLLVNEVMHLDEVTQEKHAEKGK